MPLVVRHPFAHYKAGDEIKPEFHEQVLKAHSSFVVRTAEAHPAKSAEAAK